CALSITILSSSPRNTISCFIALNLVCLVSLYPNNLLSWVSFSHGQTILVGFPSSCPLLPQLLPST
ncbi:hypothetical protein KSS87_011047, partial [Heliosperma pusillum]